MSLSILDLAKLITSDIADQIAWFQTKQLLSLQRSCPSCSATMEMQWRDDIQDKYRYIHVYTINTQMNLMY